MGLGGFLATGALGGAGQGASQALASQQNADQNLYNASELAKLNSDLEVQKNISIMQAQQNMALSGLHNYYAQKAAAAQNIANTQPQQTQTNQTTPQQQDNTSPTPVSQPSTQSQQGNSPNPIDSIAAAITKIESGGNRNAVSSQGATGSMQIMPATFKQYALPGESYDNDADRTAAAKRKIADDYNFYNGDAAKVAAAYIGGRGAVTKDGTIRSDVSDANGTTPLSYSKMVLANIAANNNQPISTPTLTAPTNFKLSGQTNTPQTWEPTEDQAIENFYLSKTSPAMAEKVLEQSMPTPLEREGMAQGIVRGSPAMQAFLSARSNKANYIAPTSIRGQVYSDANGMHTLPAQAPEGFQNIQGTDGNWYTVPVQGGTQAIAGNAAAKLAGSNSQTLAPTSAQNTDQYGRSIPTTIADAIASGRTGQGAGNTPAQASNITSNADAAKTNATLPNMVVQSKQSIAGLQNALSALNSVGDTGKGTVNSHQVWAALQNVIPGISTSDETKNYQLLGKYLNNSLATASAVTGANRSDARMDQFSHGQPSADTLNKPALQEAIQYVLSQHDAAIAGAQYIARARSQFAQQGDPTPDLTAQQSWSSVYDPKIFEFSRMTPEQRSLFISSFPKTAQGQAASSAFGQKYNQFHQFGWVQ